MSRYVAALVYRKKVGSMARKAILAYCAERANDDGTGVWASKLTIASEVECSKQTVIRAMREFVSEGLLREAGRRRTGNGYVVEYDVNVRAVEALEDAIPIKETTGPILDRSHSVTPRVTPVDPTGNTELPHQSHSVTPRVTPVDPTGNTELPHQSHSVTPRVTPVDPNRPRTVLEPSGNLFGCAREENDPPPPPEALRSDLLGEPVGKPPPRRQALALPDGWVPSAKNIEDARKANLSDEEIRNEADQFRDHHHARGTTFKNWDAAWRTWLRNARKFGDRSMAGQAFSGGYGQGGSIASIVARRKIERQNRG